MQNHASTNNLDRILVLLLTVNQRNTHLVVFEFALSRFSFFVVVMRFFSKSNVFSYLVECSHEKEPSEQRSTHYHLELVML